MRIAARFWLLASVGAVATVTVAAAGILSEWLLSRHLARVEIEAVQPLLQLTQIREALLSSRLQALAGYLHDPSNPVSRLHDHPLSMHTEAAKSALASLRRASEALLAGASAEERARYAELDAALRSYVERVAEPLIADLEAQRYYEAAAGVTRSNAQYVAIKKLLDAATQTASDIAADSAAAGERLGRTTTSALAAAALLALGALAAVGAIGIRRVRAAADVAQTLAQRLQRLELVPVQGQLPSDEIGAVCESLNRTVATLAAAFAEIRASAQTVAQAAAEIAAGNLDLSRRTETQAGSVQQTAAAAEQLSATVQNNAQAADQAKRVTDSAASVAHETESATSEAVRTIQEIAERSRRIAEIVSVIDGIAFQTNLLSLNAAIEAVRAGERGRGFAVVAAAVRGLAQQSAQAAQEIKRLIESSVASVQRGKAQIEAAGTTTARLVGHVRDVEQLIAQVAHASREQSAGVRQIGNSIVQLESVTQQNAALVEQAAAAAQRLQSEARRVEQALARFTLAAA